MNTTTGQTSYSFSGNAAVDRKEHPASYEAQVAISVLIAVLGLWSTIGNILTMLAVGMNKDMRKKSNFFLFSLAVSDLFSGLIASPLWLYRRTWGYEEWLWGDFLCKLFWFVDESTSHCTAMHVASFAIWRYIGIRRPFYLTKISKRKVLLWLLTMWILAFTFGGAIFCTLYRVEDRRITNENLIRWPSCSVITTPEGLKRHLIYYTFSSATFMLFPMAVLLTTSCLIVRELSNSKMAKSEARRKTEKRAIAQLALISVSFLFGYIPNTVYVMWSTRSDGNNYRLDYWIQVGTYFALRTSECINPIVYNISSKQMREASYRVLLFLRNRYLSRVDALPALDKKGKHKDSKQESQRSDFKNGSKMHENRIISNISTIASE